MKPVTEWEATPVFEKLNDADTFIRVLEGGARSSKTYSIIQWIIIQCLQKPVRVTCCRAKMTWIRPTILHDFVDILQSYGLYNEVNHNKTESIIKVGLGEVSFTGLDEPQKLQGRKQDIVWINEAMEASYPAFRQLEMRTEGNIILDYNPSLTSHWIYDRVLTQDKVAFIHSTQIDNPFLDANVRKTILSYEPTPENIAKGTADETLWKIYGLGLRAQHKGIVFPNVRYVNQLPESNDTWYGMDFGYTNDPTAVVELRKQGGQLWVREVIFETGLTNQDINARLKGLIPKNAKIIADSAEPKSIEELRRMGWQIEPAKKGADSVNSGISTLKAYQINVLESSLNLKKEFENYKWREDRATGEPMNEPVDVFNHGMDALRYVALNKLQVPTQFNRSRVLR